MSRYPDDLAPLQIVSVRYVCKDFNCDLHSWEVVGTLDLGMFEADDEGEEFCPLCGKEGEIA